MCVYIYIHAAAAKSLQSCSTLHNPVDGSPQGSSFPGILQARTLEWVAVSFSNAWKWKVKVKSLSRVWLFAIPWTAAYQAPSPMGFSRQEYWSGVPLPSLGFIKTSTNFYMPLTRTWRTKVFLWFYSCPICGWIMTMFQNWNVLFTINFQEKYQ